MDKGQHLRLIVSDSNASGATYKVNALATNLSAHFSQQLENSTTKDTTDGSGVTWQENEVMRRSGDINFSGLIATGTDTGGMTLADWIDKVGDSLIYWKLVMVSGENNRVVGKTVCSGAGKFTNCNPQGQNNQKATYSGTINIYGPVTVGSD